VEPNPPPPLQEPENEIDDYASDAFDASPMNQTKDDPRKGIEKEAVKKALTNDGSKESMKQGKGAFHDN